MALNNNVGATIQAVFSDPGLYNQIAQKSYLPEAVSTLWNAGNALKEQSLRGQIAEELSKPSPNMNTVMKLDAARPNNADPTSTFRWKQNLDQQKAFKDADLERIKAEKEKNKEEQKQFLRNKIAATLPTMTIGWGTSPEQVQQYKNTLAGLKTEVMNNNLSDQYNNILELEAQLNGQLPRQQAQMAMDEMTNATNLFNITKEEGGFGNDSDAYHNYLIQKYTAITKQFPEAKYDPEFNKAFMEADKLHRKKVKKPTVRPGGRRP